MNEFPEEYQDRYHKGLAEFRNGYYQPKHFELPHQEHMVNACGNIIIENAGREFHHGRAKDYFINVLEEDNVLKYPILLDFLLQRGVLEHAQNILGHYVLVKSIGIYFTPKNDHIKGSQMWHMDGDEKRRQCKYFMAINDSSTLDTGALEYIPKQKTTKACESLMTKFTRDMIPAHHYLRWYEVEKVSDDIMSQVVEEDNVQALLGPRGSALFLNTTECFHRGGRVRSIPARFTFVAQFVCGITPNDVATSPNIPGRGLGNFHFISDKYKDRKIRIQLRLEHAEGTV